MYKNSIKGFVILFFKIMTYALILATFMLVMSRVNFALLELTRTSLVTASAFSTVFIILQYVYGNFQIGYKKSKPVFLNTMISVIIADIIAVMAMLIMGVIQFPIKGLIIPSLIHLIITYVVQGILIYILAHIGNNLYFKLYSPANVMIYNNDDFLFLKIFHHIKSHDKQYKVVGIFNKPDFEKIDPDNLDTIYAIGLDSETENSLIEYCYKHNLRLIFNASGYNLVMAKNSSYVIDDVLLIELCPKQITFGQKLIKRFIDIIGSLILLILTAPVTIIVGVAIKLEDKGPIFFSQDRLTKDARVFKIYKFRSMKVDSDSRPAEVDDERITKVGKIIRKFRIDELPQAFNILKGDISIVGPRPESVTMANQYKEFLPDFDLRLKVKGGLTGYAQIFGKYNTTPEMKLMLDIKYIENFSIIEDIKLILQTFMVFVRPDSTEGFSHTEAKEIIEKTQDN